MLMTVLWLTPSLEAKKKLLEMGVDNPDTIWMRDNIREMEKAPFDGCVCILSSQSRRLPPHDRRDLGDFSFGQWSDRKFTYAELEPGIKAMAETDFKKFTDVFIRIDTGRPGKVDWFDDRVMGIVVHNMALAARGAREGGIKGLFFDPESYYGPMWTYARQAHAGTKTFDEYTAKVRQMGTDIMKAWQKEYPEITIIILRSYITVYGIGCTNPDFARDTDDPGKLEHLPYYGLLPGFVDGMLDVIGPKVTLADSGGQVFESNWKTQEDFAVIRKWLTTDSLGLVSEDVRDTYRKKFTLASNTYLDPLWRTEGWSDTDFSINNWQPHEVTMALTNGLKESDKYHWLYTEHMGFWGSFKRVPPAYLDAITKAYEASFKIPDVFREKSVKIEKNREKLAKKSKKLAEKDSFVPNNLVPETADVQMAQLWFLQANKKREGVKVLPSGLQYRVLKKGSGATPTATDRVKTHYRGALIDGTEFANSYKKGEPVTFEVTEVNKGWTEALQLMKEGSKWQLFIPSELAFGKQKQPNIPVNAVLIYEIELIKVIK